MELQRRITALQEEVADDATSLSARESKEATLRILQQRLAHFDRREQSLEEIESDLTRIEAQVDLAVDQAGARRRDLTVSAEIDFASRFLDDPFSSDLEPPPSKPEAPQPRRSAVPES